MENGFVYLVYIPYDEKEEGPIIGDIYTSMEAASYGVHLLLDRTHQKDGDTVITVRLKFKDAVEAKNNLYKSKPHVEEARAKLQKLEGELVNHPPTTKKEAKQ